MSVKAVNSADQLTGRGSFRLEENEVATLGYPRPCAFAVLANPLIVADTSGFHARGQSTTANMRLGLWPSGRRNPFISIPVDRWRIEALAAALAPVFWLVGDVLDRLGCKRQVWRVRQQVSAFDAV